MHRFVFSDRAVPVVQIGVGDSRTGTSGATWDVSEWDDAASLWSGDEPLWLDVTCDVSAMSCELGRARTADRFVYGSARVTVDNTTGWADPYSAAEDYSVLVTEDGDEILTVDGDQILVPGAGTTGGWIPGFGLVAMRPGRAIRFGVTHATLGTVWLFRGFVDEMTPTYDPVEHDTVEFSCVDALGEVNRAKLVDLPYPVGAYDAVWTRLHRILDRAQWPTSKRDIAAAGGALIPHALGGQVADLLGQTADSVGGFLYGDTNGNIVFRSRESIIYEPGTAPDATIGNVDAGDVCPVRWQRPSARADITTRVILGRDLETAIQLDDVPAQKDYGIEPYERTDLLTANDERLVALARTILATRGVQTAPRIRSVLLNAATSEASLDLQAAVNVFDPTRYRCRLLEPRGLIFDADHFATGVRHDITPNEWVTEIIMDNSAPWAVAGGRWDDALWDDPAAVWA